MAIFPSQDRPVGVSNVSYKLAALSGEIIYIPFSRSATRLLVTGQETDNAFAIVGTGGSEGPPIGLHYHREAHDVFLCLQGRVNVWANDTCRTLSAGDFASVPPGVIHAYQLLGDHSEFVGLIVPGGWEEFFRFIGEPYFGPMWPMEDARNPMEVLLPKLKQAAEKFDVIPQPHLKHCEVQAWTGDENTLPQGVQPYFLRNATGPAYVLDSTIVRPLCTKIQSGDRFELGFLEGSGMHESVLFKGKQSVQFSVHHCFYAVEGQTEFTVDGSTATLARYETLYVAAASKLSFAFKSRHSKLAVFSNGGGLVELFMKLGQTYHSPVLPEKQIPAQIDLRIHEQELNFKVVENSSN